MHFSEHSSSPCSGSLSCLSYHERGRKASMPWEKYESLAAVGSKVLVGISAPCYMPCTGQGSHGTVRSWFDAIFPWSSDVISHILTLPTVLRILRVALKEGCWNLPSIPKDTREAKSVELQQNWQPVMVSFTTVSYALWLFTINQVAPK